MKSKELGASADKAALAVEKRKFACGYSAITAKRQAISMMKAPASQNSSVGKEVIGDTLGGEQDDQLRCIGRSKARLGSTH